MGQKLRPIANRTDRYNFWCPGCAHPHIIHGPDAHPETKREREEGDVVTWAFNGDLEAPTFRPSYGLSMDEDEYRCHSFIEDGRIRYLGDSGHELAGQTVELPDVEDWPR